MKKSELAEKISFSRRFNKMTTGDMVLCYSVSLVGLYEKREVVFVKKENIFCCPDIEITKEKDCLTIAGRPLIYIPKEWVGNRLLDWLDVHTSKLNGVWIKKENEFLRTGDTFMPASQWREGVIKETEMFATKQLFVFCDLGQ